LAAEKSFNNNFSFEGQTNKVSSSTGRIEGALVSIEPQSGAILALQGGRSFQTSQFNRAFNTKRELGDAFMPIFVGSSLDSGYTLSTPVDIEPADARRRRYSHSIFPTVYEILIQNDKDNAVLLFAALGVGTIAKFAHELGFRFKVFDLRMALGRGKATPLQMGKAYAAFANSGNQITPYLINRIKNSRGQTIFKKKRASGERLMKLETATIMTKSLRDSVNFGYAKDFKNGEDNLALATGFSKDLKNGWAIGYRPGILTSLWIGAEKGRKQIGTTRDKSRVRISKIWKDFDENIPTKNLLDLAKRKRQEESPNISYYQVDVETIEGNLVKRILPFESGTAPPQSVKF